MLNVLTVNFTVKLNPKKIYFALRLELITFVKMDPVIISKYYVVSSSKVCLPHLKMAANPHILNLSPPLNMKARWFKNHVGK